ncbi:MAG: hypothetical protein IKU02_07460 [Bacteroidaceae bacterium]|nr:hypothetical protein [Bacteroidaceae bacterium]
MKAIKFFLAAIAMTFAMSANAEWKLDLGDGHFTVNADFGVYDAASSWAGFGLGATYQTEVFTSDWVTLDWDVLHFEWNAPFDSPKYANDLNFKTGLRAYSPSFAKGHLRAYTNLDLGYDLYLEKDGFTDKVESYSGFGLDYGIGLQLNKKFSLGYSLIFAKFKFANCKGHYATIAYTF